MSRTIAAIYDTFGWHDFPQTLFYNSSFALRFELGGNEPMGPIRFLRAMDRARQVAAATFAKSGDLTAAVAYHDGKRRTSAPQKAFDALSAMGFVGSFGPAGPTQSRLPDDIDTDEDDLFRYLRVCEFPNSTDQIAVLLWMAVAGEMPIQPRLRWISQNYILDPKRGIALHVYDDRGMDVIAVSPELLRPIYAQFNEWLLDYDRPRMDAVFADSRTSEN